MSKQLRCPECKTPLVRGEGSCPCGSYFFAGRVRGPSRHGVLRVRGRNFQYQDGGSWQRIDWEAKDLRGEHAQTPTTGRVTCACCESSRASDFRGGWTGPMRLTPAERQIVRLLYQRGSRYASPWGWTLGALARRFQVSEETIRRVVRGPSG